ncbi:MAG: glutamine synthetase [Clostridia bacterium]|nr:glutamine synthetase [Clostridia bacterium]
MEKIQNKYVNFQFVDILGRIREKLVPLSIYHKFLENGLSFDGSSILGYTQVNESDLLLKVDKNYIYELPQNKKIIFCEAEYKSDSRKVLKQAIKIFKEKNLEVKVGAELEFFIFDKDENNQIIMKNLDNKGYLATLSRKLTKFFERVLVILENLKFNVECVHHECAPNQYELDFRFDSPLEIADKITIIKDILKDVAEKSQLYVSFMPKPIKEVAGSGMHINLSIFREGKNIFNDENQELSSIAKYFSSGIITHIKSITAFSNPLINSYKRLNSGFESPSKIKFGKNDRTALIRVPNASGESKRIELRSPDNCCNPYLTLAAIMYSGLDGIEKKDITNIKSNRKSIKTLPKTLNESLEELNKDTYLKSFMKEAIENYVKEKQKECKEFSMVITDWELKKYL